MISLDLPGIIVKPYVRMTRRGKHVDPEAQEYLASKENLSWKVKETLQNQGLTMFPGQVPLQVTIRLFAPSSPGHKCDLDNQVKAILDACNGILFPDDRWIDRIEAERVIGVDPRLILHISEMPPPRQLALFKLTARRHETPAKSS